MLAIIGGLALALFCAWKATTYVRRSLDARLDLASGVYHVHGIPYFGVLPFVISPYSFLQRARSQLVDGPNAWLRFTICGRDIVVPAGRKAKTVVFTDKDFSFFQGYTILASGLQTLFMKPRNASHDSAGHFLRQFSRTDAIQSFIGPTIVGLTQFTARWGAAGTFDLVDELADLVFQMSLRIALGDDIAADPATVRYAVTAYRWMNASAGPDGLILPFIPTPKRVRCILAGMRLWKLVKASIAARKKDQKPRNDVLQSLLDENTDLIDCVKLTSMVSLSAGMTTSGVLTWLFVYLCVHPEWKAKVEAEITEFRFEQCIAADDMTSLGDVSIAAWEDGLPALRCCLQETIRLVSIGALPRRNMGPNKNIEGHIIRTGDFVLLMTEDANLDPDAYDRPNEFLPERDVSQHSPTGLGWGAGNYACPGQRFALCMLKAIMVALLSGYELEVVDGAGRPLTAIPPIQRELFSIGLPQQKLGMRYKRRGAGLK